MNPKRNIRGKNENVKPNNQALYNFSRSKAKKYYTPTGGAEYRDPKPYNHDYKSGSYGFNFSKPTPPEYVRSIFSEGSYVSRRGYIYR